MGLLLEVIVSMTIIAVVVIIPVIILLPSTKSFRDNMEKINYDHIRQMKNIDPRCVEVKYLVPRKCSLFGCLGLRKRNKISLYRFGYPRTIEPTPKPFRYSRNYFYLTNQELFHLQLLGAIETTDKDLAESVLWEKKIKRRLP